MASLASTNDEIDEVQNEDLDEEVAEAGDADDPDFNLDEEVAEASDADELQPKRRRISRSDKIKEGEESEEESEPEYVPKKGKRGAPSPRSEPQLKRGRISSLDKIKELNSKPKEKTPAKAPKKPKEVKVNSKHVDGKTIEQHRRGFGNVIKDQIKVLGGRGHGGWGISADCHAVFPCSFELFRRLVAPEAMEITPSAYSNLTPVILAQLSEEGATKLFGVTKTKGGTRMGSWYISKMDITHVPSKNELRVWWIMPQSSERSH